MWRLKRFVAWHEQDKKYDRNPKYNDVRSYCFTEEATDSSGMGLIAIMRFNINHGGTPLFINGQSSITPLRFTSKKFTQTAKDSIKNKRILEHALAKYSAELSDSLKDRIRNKFWFNKKQAE